MYQMLRQIQLRAEIYRTTRVYATVALRIANARQTGGSFAKVSTACRSRTTLAKPRLYKVIRLVE
jgi:hypothetical protein